MPREIRHFDDSNVKTVRLVKEICSRTQIRTTKLRLEVSGFSRLTCISHVGWVEFAKLLVGRRKPHYVDLQIVFSLSLVRERRPTKIHGLLDTTLQAVRNAH